MSLNDVHHLDVMVSHANHYLDTKDAHVNQDIGGWDGLDVVDVDIVDLGIDDSDAVGLGMVDSGGVDLDTVDSDVLSSNLNSMQFQEQRQSIYLLYSVWEENVIA